LHLGYRQWHSREKNPEICCKEGGYQHMNRSFFIKMGVLFLVFLVILLSGCQPQKEIEPVVDQDAPKLWSVLKPLSEEEKLKQRKYINTKPGDEFPIPGIEDGFVILTSGSDTLYEELCMEDLLQLADLAPVTLLIAGLAPLRSEPFYEVMTLPSNSEVVKLKLSDLLSLGFEQDYLNLIYYYHPTIWQVKDGMIQRQYLYYAVGQYEDVYTHFTTDEVSMFPVEIGKALQELVLVRSSSQEKETIKISEPTLMIHWSLENSLPQLSALIDPLIEKVQIILVLQNTEVRTRFPVLLHELATRENVEEKIEWFSRKNYDFLMNKYMARLESIAQMYPYLMIFEDQSYEIVRRFNLVHLTHPMLKEVDDRFAELNSFFLFNEKGILVNEWICRLTLGNKEDNVVMLNILEQAIAELKR